MDDFETVYRKYFDQVYFYVLSLCRDSNIAEEVTQEAFFKVLKKLDSFKGECQVSVWITQIARNTFYDYCRKNKTATEQLPEDIPAEDSIEEHILDKSSARQIHIILHELQEPYKEVFWMRTFGELPFKEIGELHGKTESWARVTYYRAKLMIKEELK